SLGPSLGSLSLGSCRFYQKLLPGYRPIVIGVVPVLYCQRCVYPVFCAPSNSAGSVVVSWCVFWKVHRVCPTIPSRHWMASCNHQWRTTHYPVNLLHDTPTVLARRYPRWLLGSC